MSTLLVRKKQFIHLRERAMKRRTMMNKVCEFFFFRTPFFDASHFSLGRVSKREKREISCIRRDKKDSSDPGSPLISPDCSCDEDHNTYDCPRRPINWPTLSDLPLYKDGNDSSSSPVCHLRFPSPGRLPDYSGDDDSSSSPTRPSYSDGEEEGTRLFFDIFYVLIPI